MVYSSINTVFIAFFVVSSYVCQCHGVPNINGTSKDILSAASEIQVRSIGIAGNVSDASVMPVVNRPHTYNTIRIPLRIGKALGPPFVKILNRRLSIQINTSDEGGNGTSSDDSSSSGSQDILSMEIILNNTSENKTETTSVIMEPYNNISGDTKKNGDMMMDNSSNKGNVSSSSSSLFEKLTARILSFVASTTTTTTQAPPTTPALLASETQPATFTGTSVITSRISKPLSTTTTTHAQNLVVISESSKSHSNDLEYNTLRSQSQDHGNGRSHSGTTTTTKPQIRREERKRSIGGFISNIFNMFRETRKAIGASFRGISRRLLRFPQEQEEKRQRRIKSEISKSSN